MHVMTMTMKKDTMNLKVNGKGYGENIISKTEKFKKKKLNGCNIFCLFFPPCPSLCY